MKDVSQTSKLDLWLRRHRGVLQASFDIAVWIISLIGGVLVRYDFNFHQYSWLGIIYVMPVVILAQIDAGIMMGLYNGKWRFGSFDEVGALARSLVAVFAFTFIADAFLLPGRAIPLGSVVIGAALAFLSMCAGRWWWRARVEKQQANMGDRDHNLIIYGAGEAGYQSLVAIQRDPNCGYRPVAFLDDDLTKRNLRILGVDVVGTGKDLKKVVKDFSADTLLVALPSASAKTITSILESANSLRISIKAIPKTKKLIGDAIEVFDIKDLDPQDLLNRDEIEIDEIQIREFLKGKRVLITGAGGSIGSEIARQIHNFEPSELILLDRDESALLNVQLSIDGNGDLRSQFLMLADIRDEKRLEQIFSEKKPEIVFHAAALKHLTLLERFPYEAWRSNVIGTLNVLNVSKKVGVKSFVNISTDKAADATSVLGISKRIAERLTAGIEKDEMCQGTYVSVRFANVLGSRGSVLDIFRAQAKAGLPLTVTNKDVTRYVMTIPEAVRLVMQAAAIGRQGEVLVLDMGVPVKVLEIAKYFAMRHNPPLDVVFTGLRPGEKLHEVLIGEDEKDDRPFHQAISQIKVPPLDWYEVTKFLDGEGDDLYSSSSVSEDMRQRLISICAKPSKRADSIPALEG